MWTVFTKEKSEQNGPDFSRDGPDRKTKSRNVEFSIVSGPSSTAGGGIRRAPGSKKCDRKAL